MSETGNDIPEGSNPASIEGVHHWMMIDGPLSHGYFGMVVTSSSI